jgi:Nucleolar protein 12 (25kDa)
MRGGVHTAPFHYARYMTPQSREFLTGFHKRKLAKKEESKKRAQAREKEERLEARREVHTLAANILDFQHVCDLETACARRAGRPERCKG